MGEPAPDDRLKRQQVREAMEREIEKIPFPPMVMVHRGWFGDKETPITLEELQALNRAREDAESRSWWLRFIGR